MTLDARVAVRRDVFAVSVDLRVAPGRTLALVGPNGAGKSTVLQALAGLIDYDGSVTLDGTALDPLDPERRRVGYVFQEYLLFPHLSVLENVAFGPRAQGRGRADARRIAWEWLDRLELAELAARRPPQLSGGQQQRVALARTLASDPRLLLLDEPLAALDSEIRSDVRTELARHLRMWAGPTVLVTHSFDDVVALADEVIVIERGRETQRGTVSEVAARPATPYVRRLVGVQGG